MNTGSRTVSAGSFRRRAARFVGVALLVVLLAGAAVPAIAAITLQQAVQQVQQDTGGKVLSAQTLTIGKHKIYRIKVLTPDGQVKVVQVRAEP